MAEADPRIETATAPDTAAVAKPKRKLLRPLLMFGVPLGVSLANAAGRDIPQPWDG